jgi:hypothetical protein
MQQLYLSDLGDVNPNAAPDVTASNPDAQTETDKGEKTQTLNSKKGETAEMEEETIPNPAVGKGVDEDTENIKIAEDALKSLVDSISSDRAVPDASASLAQDQPVSLYFRQALMNWNEMMKSHLMYIIAF